MVDLATDVGEYTNLFVGRPSPRKTAHFGVFCMSYSALRPPLKFWRASNDGFSLTQRRPQQRFFCRNSITRGNTSNTTTDAA